MFALGYRSFGCFYGKVHMLEKLIWFRMYWLAEWHYESEGTGPRERTITRLSRRSRPRNRHEREVENRGTTERGEREPGACATGAQGRALVKGTTRRGGRGLKSAATESPIIFRSLSFPPNQRIKASLRGPPSVFSYGSSSSSSSLW
ncbi:PREDICTED: uncharacterized protein LOC107187948 [Dufourea novaeangliae]|uniref:uncharacterized protein LOC107187948 n=1 Tax=Dufourea novaeangliae TaxID=178035 RepID=UPI0007678400|nr:PREDICTED: uncharacterized protein LOC107187948 [Dufourea novaeangliae]